MSDAMTSDAVEVWQANLDCEPSTLARLFRLLSSDEAARAGRFHFARDRERYIVARGTLRVLLGRYLDEDPARLCFSYGEHGKPALAPEFSARALHFNVSHSQDRALYAVTKLGEVGIDLEQAREDLPVTEIAQSFFAPEEIAILAQLSLPAQLERFYTYWTRKEAYSKARGQGLNLNPRRIDASTHLDPAPFFFSVTVDDVSDAGCSLCDLDIGVGYVAALAVVGRPKTVQMHPPMELFCPSAL